MTGSSEVVLSNLAYLIGAVVLAIIGGLIVWLRHRQPKSVDANVESFSRGLRALAPDASLAGSRRGTANTASGGLRIQPRPAVGAGQETAAGGDNGAGTDAGGTHRDEIPTHAGDATHGGVRADDRAGAPDDGALRQTTAPRTGAGGPSVTGPSLSGPSLNGPSLTGDRSYQDPIGDAGNQTPVAKRTGAETG